MISRKDVGSYDVAVVREKEPGPLNAWLADNGYRKLEGADDLFEWYRKKGYVFACVRVREAAREKGAAADLHPLRFTFATGGATASTSRCGSPASRPGGSTSTSTSSTASGSTTGSTASATPTEASRSTGATTTAPSASRTPASAGPTRRPTPTSAPIAGLVPTVTRLCQKLHPGERYYLTNIRAAGLAPRDVRDWADDLWLFPYYTDPRMVPHDAREGGPASAAYPNLEASLRDRARRWPPPRPRGCACRGTVRSASRSAPWRPSAPP